MRRYVIFSLFIVCVLVLFFGNARAETGLGLYPPVDVVFAGVFKDGGTIRISLKDCVGNTLDFYLDGRGGLSVRNYGNIYLDAYPDTSSSFKIPIGSIRENVILNLLDNWLAKQKNVWNPNGKKQRVEYIMLYVEKVIYTLRKR